MAVYTTSFEDFKSNNSTTFDGKSTNLSALIIRFKLFIYLIIVNQAGERLVSFDFVLSVCSLRGA